MKKIIMLLTAYTLSLTPILSQGIWSPRASLPDSTRALGIGFSIGNYGYMGLGTHDSHANYPCLDDFWQFDPSTNSWTQKANFPGTARICPATFVIGNYAYVVTGQVDDSLTPKYTNQCWQYNSTNNTWTQKANFPGTARAYDVGFAVGGKGYVGTGSQYNFDYRKDFWAYDTTTDTWTQIADLPTITARFSASGFSANGNGYVCFGYDSVDGVLNDIWEYDTGTNTWTQKANNPGPAQCGASGFVINNNIYVGSGTDDVGKCYNQFWQYNTPTDTWASESYFPGPSRCLVGAFAIGDTGYAGLGVDSASLFFNNLYKFYPDSTLGIETIFNSYEIVVYPNPFKDECFIKIPNEYTGNVTFSLFDAEGAKVEMEELPINSDNTYTLQRKGLKSGVYVLCIKYNEQAFYKKLIIIN